MTCHPLFTTFKYTQHTKLIHQYQCWAVPMIFMKKTAHFQHLKKTGYGPSDGPTIHPTDRPTDMTSYIDARTHLKIARLLGTENQNCHAHSLHLAMCDILYKQHSEEDEQDSYTKSKKKEIKK